MKNEAVILSYVDLSIGKSLERPDITVIDNRTASKRELRKLGRDVAVKANRRTRLYSITRIFGFNW